MRGEKTLEELRAAGINTEVVRRAKVTAKGDREIELHDRAGAEVDRIIGHTAPSIGELAKQARLDAGQATERIDGVVMRVIGPRREHNQE